MGINLRVKGINIAMKGPLYENNIFSFNFIMVRKILTLGLKRANREVSSFSILVCFDQKFGKNNDQIYLTDHISQQKSI